MIHKIREKVSQISKKSFFRDSFWMLLAKVLSMVIQLAYFILLARYLGSEYYGIFEGTKAIWAIIFPFIGMGAGDILVQDVSRVSDAFPKRWGDTISVFLISIAIALIFIFPAVVLFLPTVPPIFILLTLIADLGGLKLCGLAERAFIANHQIKQASQYGMIYTISKLIGVLFLPLFPSEVRLQGWGVIYCLSSLLPAFILYMMIWTRIGKPIFRRDFLDLDSVKQGFFFSLSESASGINAQMDRAMLVSLASPAAAGIYSAGYRFIDMGYIPIFAIQGASYPRFFKHGEQGIRGTVGFAKKLMLPGLAYGILTLITLVFLAPFVQYILGEEFAQSSQVLLWLAPIHLLYMLQFLAADSLTGAGFQRSRSFIQVTAAVLNISLNLYLIPIYSWQGAIWATLSSELFKSVSLWIVVGLLYRRERKGQLK